MKITLKDMCHAREIRQSFVRDLIHEHKAPVVMCTLNIPGPEKLAKSYITVVHYLYEKVLENYPHAVEAFNYWSRTGAEWYISVPDDPMKLKEFCVDIEEKHPLGRIFDIDVITGTSEKISREQLGLPPRRCYICDRPAFECARAQTHSYEELINSINNSF